MLVDHELERSLLSSVSTSPVRLSDCVMEISPEDFDHPAHQEIYKVILTVNRDSGNCDLAEMHAEMVKRNTYQKYRSEFMDMCKAYSTTQHKPLIKGVKLLSLKRKTAAHCGSMISVLHTDEMDSQSIVSSLAGFVDEIANVDKELTSDFKSTHIDDLRDRQNYILTGYPSIDCIIGGLASSEYSLWGARTHVGKTSVALDISIYAANSCPVVFYTAEDSTKSIKYKILSKISGLHTDIIRSGSYSADEKTCLMLALDKAKKLDIEIVSGLSDVNDILADLNYKMMKKYRRLVFIDYAQKLNDRECKSKDRYLVIGSASHKIHSAVLKHDTHIGIPAQLGREVDKSRTEPELTDFRECGNLEQDAMLAFLMWCDEKDSKDIMIKCAKNKTSGKYFKQRLYWDASHFKFTDIEPMNKSGNKFLNNF